MGLRKRLLLWMVAACFSSPGLAGAITVLQPAASTKTKIAEGIEFSAYVKGNRWDMSDSADIITSESKFLSNETFSDGVYRTTSVEDDSPDGRTDAKFYLTWPGLPEAVYSIESGQKYPIDTSIYRKLTVKIRHLNTSGLPTNSLHPVQVFFFKDEKSIRDAVFGFTNSISVLSDGDWHIVQFDLIDDVSPNSNYSWSEFSTIKGLRIDPTIYSNTGIEVDWIRLTAPGDAGTGFNVQWSGGKEPYSVTARLQNDVAVTLASDITGTSANVDFSTMPRGEYTVEVLDGQETGTSTGIVQINEAPLFNFLQPDIRGDVDRRYSLVEAGNQWGPFDSSDVASTKELTAINFANPPGTLTATSTGSDSLVIFNTPRAIDTLKYRMLSYTMSVSGERDIGLGSVTRVLWGNDLSTLSTSKSIVLQEGLNTYELGDLSNLLMEGGQLNKWQGAPIYFRLDPHEFPEARNIRLDDVTIAPLFAAYPNFNVTWLDSDPDNNASIQLFADVDHIPGNSNEVLIASDINEDPGTNSFTWNAPDHVPDGEYFLYARIDDGLNRTIRYATGPISVGDGAAIELTIVEPDGVNDNVVAADEFSRHVEGNPWDMSDNADVPFSRSRDISAQSISGGYLSGTSSGPDPFLYLLFPGATNGHSASNGLLNPISTSRYRYLTFKVRYTGPGPHFFQAVFLKDNLFSSQSIGFTEGLKILPGDWNVVTIDLQAMSSVDSAFAWQDVAQVKGLRIDPTNIPGTHWEFDWFTLTGQPIAASQYEVRWTAKDIGESSLNINAVDADGVRIPLLQNVAPTATNASVDLTRLPAGSYLVEFDAIPGASELSATPINILPNLVIPENELRNISTRTDVGILNDIAIAGFIISGNAQKCLVIRGRGPSVGVPAGVSRMDDPLLQLKSGSTSIATNDNWQSQEISGDAGIIESFGAAPANNLESAIYKCLDPGAYTALLSGKNGSVGVGIVEVLDVDSGMPYLANISTRSRVGTGDLVTIAGFIISGNTPKQILIRGRGPTVGVPTGVQRLNDPRLQLFAQFSDGSNMRMLNNDNWTQAENANAISATGKAPTDSRESAILMTLDPGAYTAILDGVGGNTGAGIVEVFDLSGR
jgi:hypothetical protein